MYVSLLCRKLCSSVECCVLYPCCMGVFCTRVAWVCFVLLMLCKEEGSSPVSLQLLRGGIWVCMRCFVCCMFMNCLVKQFAMCLGVFVILLLNVMELLSVVGGAILDRQCMVFHKMCVVSVVPMSV